MPRDWKDISIDEMLNWDYGQTGVMAQYDRILRHRETEALSEVSAGLIDVKKVIHEAAGGLEERLEETAKAQRRLQKIMLALTGAIAIATLFYAVFTWMSVQVQREANEIQRQIISMNAAEGTP